MLARPQFHRQWQCGLCRIFTVVNGLPGHHPAEITVKREMLWGLVPDSQPHARQDL